MPQLELTPWLFNFTLAWFFLFLIMTVLLKMNFAPTNYTTVAPSPKTNLTNNWLWT
uniref:ATP synthase F0 subunit 8 n=1 Tax=Coscinasterias acutispina TaxID=60565 RepID=UPI00202966F2|nr:ATP synthase F0 subunit 8 [Coscinasterias acutispina]UPY85817.1 ATP synthase F0 subunit 8 [Coscinasterias acutispina]